LICGNTYNQNDIRRTNRKVWSVIKIVQTKLKDPCYAKEYKLISKRIHTIKTSHAQTPVLKTKRISTLINRENTIKELNDLIKQRDEMRV